MVHIPCRFPDIKKEKKMTNIQFTDEDLVLLSDALEAQIRAYGTEAAQTAHEEDQGALIRHSQALDALKGKVDDDLAWRHLQPIFMVKYSF